MDHLVTASVSNLCQISAAASSVSFVVQLFNTASTHKNNKQTKKNQKQTKTVFQKTKQENKQTTNN